MPTSIKQQKRARRHSRIRARISGTASRPRLSVYRSNRFIYAQIIDDEKGRTILSESDKTLKSGTKATKTKRAIQVGENLATAARQKKIPRVTFDRGGFRFAGRIKALAESARRAGLVF